MPALLNGRRPLDPLAVSPPDGEVDVAARRALLALANGASYRDAVPEADALVRDSGITLDIERLRDRVERRFAGLSRLLLAQPGVFHRLLLDAVEADDLRRDEDERRQRREELEREREHRREEAERRRREEAERQERVTAMLAELMQQNSRLLQYLVEQSGRDARVGEATTQPDGQEVEDTGRQVPERRGTEGQDVGAVRASRSGPRATTPRRAPSRGAADGDSEIGEPRDRS